MPWTKTDAIALLTPDETGALFARFGDHPRNMAVFLTAYRHGLRASEIGLLRTDDLDFKRLCIMLHPAKGKLFGRTSDAAGSSQGAQGISARAHP